MNNNNKKFTYKIKEKLFTYTSLLVKLFDTLKTLTGTTNSPSNNQYITYDYIYLLHYNYWLD